MSKPNRLQAKAVLTSHKCSYLTSNRNQTSRRLELLGKKIMASANVSVEFKNKVVMITGASSGIGLATARAFAEKGALLSLAGFRACALQAASEICQSVSPQGAQPCCTAGDLTDDNIRELFRENTINAFGRIDVLVNCAGRLSLDNIMRFDLNVFDKLMDINVRVVYHLTALCVPHLVETKGNIVNISSAASQENRTSSILSYSMSKAALDIFTKQTAGELGPRGIRVNSVNPGFTCTKIMGEMDADAFQAKYANKSVFDRCAEPKEIAKAILFLASEESSFITGCNFLVDGGFTTKRICN